MFHETEKNLFVSCLSARAWYGDLDHSEGLVLRRRTVPHDDSSLRKKAKRTRKTLTVPDTKGNGAACAVKNDGAAHQS